MKPIKEAAPDFRNLVEGPVILKGEVGYDEARTIWNGMFDRKPAIIVRCLQTSDVSQAVNFAKTHQLLIAVKGGGHNSAGNAVCDDGMMIDLSLMQGVDVDAEYTVDYGRSLGYKKGGPAGTQNARILLSVDEERFWNLLVDLLTR